MTTLGNILWFVFGGFFTGITWYLLGLLWCVSIIGIPIGLQCFKFGTLAFFPFGKNIVYRNSGAASTLLNIIWLLLAGLWLAIGFFVWGLFLCVTIIGIPFGKQYFKFARLALSPFGAEVV